MDLTIDDYRNQLNQAQNQIQAQIAQVCFSTNNTMCLSFFPTDNRFDVSQITFKSPV